MIVGREGSRHRRNPYAMRGRYTVVDMCCITNGGCCEVVSYMRPHIYNVYVNSFTGKVKTNDLVYNLETTLIIALISLTIWSYTYYIFLLFM